MSNLSQNLFEIVKQNIKHEVTEIQIDDLLDGLLISKEFDHKLYKEFSRDDLCEQEEEEESSTLRSLELFKRDMLLSFTDSSLGKDIPSLAANHVIDKFGNEFNNTKYNEFNNHLAQVINYLLSVFLNSGKTRGEKESIEQYLVKLMKDLTNDSTAKEQFFTVFSLISNLTKGLTGEQNYDYFFSNMGSCINKLKNFLKKSPFAMYLVKDTALELSNAIVTKVLNQKQVDDRIKKLGIRALFNLGLCFQHLDIHLELIDQLLKNDFEFSFRDEFNELVDQLFGYSAQSSLNFTKNIEKLPCFTASNVWASSAGEDVNDITIATDGTFLYIHQKSNGLTKLGTGKGSTKQGAIYGRNQNFRKDNRGSLAYACGKLYFRSPSTKPTPFIMVDTASLEEIPLNFSPGEEKFHFIDGEDQPVELNYTLHGHELADSRRDKAMSKMISDGRFVYIISKYGALRVNEKESEGLYPCNCLVNVDIFDGMHNCAHVVSFPLLDPNRILIGTSAFEYHPEKFDILTDGIHLIFIKNSTVFTYNMVTRAFTHIEEITVTSSKPAKYVLDLYNSRLFYPSPTYIEFPWNYITKRHFHKDLIGAYSKLNSIIPPNFKSHEIFSSKSCQLKGTLRDYFEFFCTDNLYPIGRQTEEKAFDKWTNVSLLLTFLATAARTSKNLTEINTCFTLDHIFSPHILSCSITSLKKLYALYKNILANADYTGGEGKGFLISSLLTLFNTHLRQLVTLQFNKLPNFNSEFSFLRSVIEDASMFIKEFAFTGETNQSLTVDQVSQCLHLVENYSNLFDIEYPNMSQFLDMIIDPSPHLADLKRSALVALAQSNVIYSNDTSISRLAELLEVILKRNDHQLFEFVDILLTSPTDAKIPVLIDYEKAYEGLVTPFLKRLFEAFYKISDIKDDSDKEKEKDKAQLTENFHKLFLQYEKILHVLIQHVTTIIQTIDTAVKNANIMDRASYEKIQLKIGETVSRLSYAYRLCYASLHLLNILIKDKYVIYKTWHHLFDMLLIVDKSLCFYKDVYDELCKKDDLEKKLPQFERWDCIMESSHPIDKTREMVVSKEFSRGYDISFEFDPLTNLGSSSDFEINYTIDQDSTEKRFKFQSNEAYNQSLKNVTKFSVVYNPRDSNCYGLKVHIHNLRMSPQAFGRLGFPLISILKNSIKSFFFFNFNSKCKTKDKDLEEMLQSKLFSGGIDELLDLQTFSEEYKTFISILKANPNYSLFEKRLSFDKDNLEETEIVPFEFDEILKSENMTVEKFIGYAQFALKPRLPWIVMGGNNAGAIVRAAFAVIMKQEKLYDMISQVVRAIDDEELKLGQNLGLKGLSGIDNFEYLLLVWTEVSKLRQWYSEQIKDIAEAKKDDFDKQNEDFVKSIIEKCRFLFQLNAPKKGGKQKLKTGNIKFLELFAQTHFLANQNIANDIVKSNVIRFKKNLMQGKIEEGNTEMENTKRNIQSVVNCVKLTKISIESLKNAIREMNTKAKFREIAMSLLNSFLLEMKMPGIKLFIVMQIITSLRQTSGKKLISIDEEIRSASPLILSGIMNRFHQFLNIIFSEILSGESGFIISAFMDCLFWNFKARDHQVLIQIGLFENMFIHSPNEAIREAWKIISQPKAKSQYTRPTYTISYDKNLICTQLLELFQTVSTSIVGRIIDETHMTSEFNDLTTGFFKKKSSVFDYSFEKLIESIGEIIKIGLDDFAGHYLHMMKNITQYEKFIKEQKKEDFSNIYFDEEFLTVFLILLYKFTVNNSPQIIKYMKNPELISNLLVILRFTSTKNKVPLANILKVYLAEMKNEDIMNIVFFLKKQELFTSTVDESNLLFLSNEIIGDDKFSPRKFIGLYLLDSLYMLRKGIHDPKTYTFSHEYEEGGFLVNLMKSLYGNPKWEPAFDEIFIDHLAKFDCAKCSTYPSASLILSVLNGDFDEIHYGSKVLLKYKSDYSKSIPEKVKDKLEEYSDSCANGYVIGFMETEYKVNDMKNNNDFEDFITERLHTKRTQSDKFVLLISTDTESYCKNKIKSNDVQFQTKPITDVILIPEIEVQISNQKVFQILIDKFNEMLSIFEKNSQTIYDLFIFTQISRSIHSLFNCENKDVTEYLRSTFSLDKIAPIIKDLSSSAYTCIKINQWMTMNLLKCYLDIKSSAGFELRDNIELGGFKTIKCKMITELKALRIFKNVPQNGILTKIINSNLEMNSSNSQTVGKLNMVKYGDTRLSNYLNCAILVDLEAPNMVEKVLRIDDAWFLLVISKKDLAIAREKITHPYIVVDSSYEQLDNLISCLESGGNQRSTEVNLEKCDPAVRAAIEKLQTEAKIDEKIKFSQCNSINPKEIIQEELGKTSSMAVKVTKSEITNYLSRLAKSYLRYFVVHLLHENPSIVNKDNFDFFAKQFKIVYLDACEISNLSVFSYKKFSYFMPIFSMLIEKEEEINPKVKLMNISERSRIFNSYTFSISEADICRNIQSELIDYFYENELFKKASNPSAEVYLDLVLKVMKLSIITINYESKTFNQYLSKLLDLMYKLFTFVSSHADTISEEMAEQFVKQIRREGLDKIFVYLSDSITEEKDNPSNRTKNLINFAFEFARLYTDMFRKGWNISKGFSFNYISSALGSLMFNINILHLKAKYMELRDKSLFQNKNIIDKLTSDISLPCSKSPIEVNFDYKGVNSLRITPKNPISKGKMLIASDLGKNGVYNIVRTITDSDTSAMELYSQQKVLIHNSGEIKQELWMCGNNETYRFGNPDLRDTNYPTPQKALIETNSMIKKVLVLPASTVVITSDSKAYVSGGSTNSGLSDNRRQFCLESRWNEIAKEKVIDFSVNTNNGSCMVTEQAVWVKGNNGSNCFGEVCSSGYDADFVMWNTPFPAKTVSELSCGYCHTIFRLDDGTCYGAGCNNEYELTLPSRDNIRTLTKLNIGDNPCVQVSCGYHLSLFIIREPDGNQRLYSCGTEEYNGRGSSNDRVFKKLPAIADLSFRYCRIGNQSSLAITTDGKLYTWGQCGYYNLGDEQTNTKYEPTLAYYYKDRTVIEAQITERILAVKAVDTDGKTKIWMSGYNGDGLFGQSTGSSYNTVPVELTFFGDANVKFSMEGSNYAMSFLKSNFDTLQQCFEFKCSKCQASKSTPMVIHEKKLLCMDCYKSDDQLKVTLGIRGCRMDNVESLVLPDLVEINQAGTKTPHEIACVDCKKKIGEGIAVIAADNQDMTKVISFCEECYPYSSYFASPKFVYFAKGEINYSALPVISNHAELLGLDMQNPIKASQFRALNDEGKNDFFKECGDVLDMINKEYDEIRNEHILEYIKNIEADPTLKDPKCLRNLEIFSKLSDSQILIIEGLVTKLNQSLKDLRRFIYMDEPNMIKDIYIANLIFMNKKARSELFENIIYDGASNVSPDRFVLRLSRGKAYKFKQKAQVDYQGQYTIFGQSFNQLKNAPLSQFQGSKSDRMFKVELYGEGATDAGGPYREMMNVMCEELQSPWLDLFIPTPNNKSTSGHEREKWTINPSAKSGTHLEMFTLLGKLFGFAARSLGFLNLNLPSFIWKQILGQPLDMNDLEKIDIHTANFLSDLMSLEAKGIDKNQFEYIYDQQFTTILSNGKEVEVQAGGSNRKLSYENSQEYVRLALKTRFEECVVQVEALKAGFFEVIKKEVALLINWKDLEERICGNLIVDVELLKKNTNYESWYSGDQTITWFWQAINNFSNEEKILYLKFVWGRSRLPLSDEGFDRKHKITKMYSSHSDISLPVSHTCFFTLDLPQYSSYEILYNKLLYAIKFCNEIDNDYNASSALEDI